MPRPKFNDPENARKREEFNRLRGEGVSLRECAKQIPIAKSVAQTWELERRAAAEPQEPHAETRAILTHLVAEGFPEEKARASQVYWRVRLGSPPAGALAWHTEHLAVFVSQQLDVSTPEELFAPLGDEGRALWLAYLAAMARRAGLLQRDDGTWVADPDHEPPART